MKLEMFMSMLKRLFASFAVLAVLALGACNNGDDGGTAHKLQNLSDVPLPRGYSLDSKETIIFGEADRWTGKIVYGINSNADDMLDYLRREMPTLGWQEVSVFRANTSVMTFQRQGRVATIQIFRGRVYGSNVEMVVAPQTGASVAPAAGAPAGRLRADELPPPPPKSPNRAVAIEPLK